MIRRTISLILAASLAACASPGAAARKEAPVAARLPAADPAVSPVLIPMMDGRRPAKPTRDDYVNGALSDIVRFTTPAGFRLRTRFYESRVPLVQALGLSSDDQLRIRLQEAARWSATPNARAEGLIGIAAERNPAHLKYFKEALLDRDTNVQFAAVEALQFWGRAEAVEYLANAADRAWTPLVRAYAAQALLRLGDQRGRQRLLSLLRDPEWLSRAMAARYLGELGKAEDADLLLSRIGPEREYKFVLAEVCVASLKLLAKKAPAPAAPVPPPILRHRPVPAPRSTFDLEPLVVIAPRLNVPRHLVDVRIDNDLVRLLEELANEPPPAEHVLTPEEELLNGLATPTGYALKARYSNIDVLLTEGLAGTTNFTLIARMETIARSNPSPRVRATALVALGYEPNRRDLAIFQDALRDNSAVVRFGAVEALSALAALGESQAVSIVGSVAQADPSPAIRAFAAQALTSTGDPYGRQLLFQYADDRDWVLRSMAYYAFGEWGDPDDYYFIMNRFNREGHDFARAEMCLALLKLSKRFP